MMNNTTSNNRLMVMGVFRDTESAQQAINALKDAGYDRERISVLMHDRGESKALAEATGAQAAEGAATGALAGGVLGGMGGWLAGVAGLAIPGVGPFIAAGALGTALAGAVLGAGIGAVGGALVNMGVPEEEATWYQDRVSSGRALVMVDAGARSAEARAIFDRFGAEYRPEPGRSAPANVPAEMTGSNYGGGAEQPARLYGGQAGYHNWNDAETHFRDQWQSRGDAPMSRWEAVAPGFRYGYEMANDDRFRNREWDDVAPMLETEFTDWVARSGYPDATTMSWDRFKADVREGWNIERGRQLQMEGTKRDELAGRPFYDPVNPTGDHVVPDPFFYRPPVV